MIGVNIIEVSPGLYLRVRNRKMSFLLFNQTNVVAKIMGKKIFTILR